MSQKFIFVNVDGDYQETPGAFESSDFINATVGVADAGKPIVLDATGYLDPSFIQLADLDHGGLSGLGDDDHNQYTLADGTRAFTGDQSMGSNKLTDVADGTLGTDGVNLGQVQDMTSGLQDFRESVIDKDLLTPPGAPTSGDRYIIGQPTDTATGDWAGHEGEITEWDGSAWTFEPQPDNGTYCYVEDEASAYIFNHNTFASGTWVVWGTGVYTAGDGIDLTGAIFSVDLDASDSGLELGSGTLGIDWATTFTIDGADDLALKASDLASTANGEGASVVGIEDSGGNFVADNVEDALAEIMANTSGEYNLYTAGTNITVGDLLYVSANNTVSIMPTNAGHVAIGVAGNTVTTGNDVQVMKDDSILTGILSGATAGTKYYWNGTGWQTTMLATAGRYIWLGGVAKNATDVQVETRFIKRNSL